MSQVLNSENSDVFLSYAREDVGAAQKLAALLEANGLTVWWDRRLVAGDAINTTIERAIDGAKAVIVLWSPHAIASRWVNGEAETAAEAGKLLPVKIAECRLPLNFRTLHTPEVFRSSWRLFRRRGWHCNDPEAGFGGRQRRVYDCDPGWLLALPAASPVQGC
jgi:TIR domain